MSSGETGINVDSTAAANVAGPSARMIAQQCLSAKLQVRPASADTDDEFVQVLFGSCFVTGGN